jgi:hypothetical protein
LPLPFIDLFCGLLVVAKLLNDLRFIPKEHEEREASLNWRGSVGIHFMGYNYFCQPTFEMKRTVNQPTGAGKAKTTRRGRTFTVRHTGSQFLGLDFLCPRFCWKLREEDVLIV